jgi:hypothetical protein
MNMMNIKLLLKNNLLIAILNFLENDPSNQ